MHAHLVALALALLSQLGGDRYPLTPPGEAAAPKAGAAAPAADAAETGSQIVIPVDTPQPTLVDDPAAPAAGAPDPAPPLPPTEADPLDSAAPLAGAAATDLAQPPAESSVLAGGPKPADVMREMLQAPVSGQLTGVPVTLGAAVGGAATRSDQTARAQAYWALSAAVTRYHLALQEAVELAALRQGVSAPSEAWDTAREEFDAQVLAAREAAIAGQWQLQRLTGAAPGSSFPLPADAPHCGRYNTRYDEIFAVRTDPAAQQLNELLPRLYGELASEARAAADAADWLAFVSEHRDPATDGTGLLRAYELLSLRRRAFVEAAHAYNDSIADYAQLAAPDEVAPERVVSMLIRVSAGGGTGGEMGSGVQPAGAVDDSGGAVPAADDQGATEVGGRTFADRVEVRRPFSRFRNRERSIVVRRGPLQRLLGRE